MKDRNVCIVASIFPPDIGGPSTYVVNAAKKFRECGYNIFITTYGERSYEQTEDYEVYRVKRNNNVPGFISLPLRIIELALLTAKVVRENNCSFIYFMDPSVSGIPAYIASILTGKKLVLRYVGDWAWEYAFGKGQTEKLLSAFIDYPDGEKLSDYFLMWEEFLFPKCYKIITPSNYLKGIVKKISPKADVEVVYNPIEIAKIDETSKEIKEKYDLKGKNILAVGRHVKWKRFEDIISAMTLLPEKLNANLLIVGSGPETENLKKLATEKNLLSKIRFLHSLPHKEVLKLMKASDVFSLVSLYEGMSFLLLEASSMNCPIITSNIPANLEVIKDNVTGKIVKRKNPKELAKALEEILTNKKLAKKLSENSLENIKRKNSWKTYIYLFDRAIYELFD